MKHKIENLIKQSELELQNETDKIARNEPGAEEMVMYWAIRLQTLKQVLELLEQEENVACITEVSQ